MYNVYSSYCIFYSPFLTLYMSLSLPPYFQPFSLRLTIFFFISYSFSVFFSSSSLFLRLSFYLSLTLSLSFFLSLSSLNLYLFSQVGYLLEDLSFKDEVTQLFEDASVQRAVVLKQQCKNMKVGHIFLLILFLSRFEATVH